MTHIADRSWPRRGDRGAPALLLHPPAMAGEFWASKLREQPFYNTAQLYAKLGQDIRGGTRTVPGFGTAVDLLDLIEAVKDSSSRGGCQQPAAPASAIT